MEGSIAKCFTYQHGKQGKLAPWNKCGTTPEDRKKREIKNPAEDNQYTQSEATKELKAHPEHDGIPGETEGYIIGLAEGKAGPKRAKVDRKLNSPKTLEDKVKTLVEQGKYGEAIGYYDQILANHPVYAKKYEIEQKRQELRVKAITSDAKQAMEEAVKLIERRDYQGALVKLWGKVKDLEKLGNKADQELLFTFYSRIGDCYKAKGEPGKAFGAYNKALGVAEEYKRDALPEIKARIAECQRENGGTAQTRPASAPKSNEIFVLHEATIKKQLAIVYKALEGDNIIDEKEKADLEKQGISKAFLDYLDARGVEGGNKNNEITRAEFEAGMKKILNEDTIKALTAQGKKPEDVVAAIIEDFKTCKEIAWVGIEDAAKQYETKYGNSSELYDKTAGKEGLKVEAWLVKGCNSELKAAAKVAIERITGKAVDDKTRLNSFQFRALLYALALASHSPNPGRYELGNIGTAGKPEGDNVMAWATKGSSFEVKAQKTEDGKDKQASSKLLKDEEREITRYRAELNNNKALETLTALLKRARTEKPDESKIGLRASWNGYYVSQLLSQYILGSDQGSGKINISDVSDLTAKKALAEELEAALKDPELLGDQSSRTKIGYRFEIIKLIVKIKKEAGENSESTKKFIDDHTKTLWESNVWKGHEGEKAKLALQVAQMKTELFISSAQGKTYKADEKLDISKEVKVIADNWNSTVTSGRNNGTVSSVILDLINGVAGQKLEELNLNQEQAGNLFIVAQIYKEYGDQIKAKSQDAKAFDHNRKSVGERYNKAFPVSKAEESKNKPGKQRRKKQVRDESDTSSGGTTATRTKKTASTEDNAPYKQAGYVFTIKENNLHVTMKDGVEIIIGTKKGASWLWSDKQLADMYGGEASGVMNIAKKHFGSHKAKAKKK